jgi:hypothetical protein
MPLISLCFNNPIQVSVQKGDIAYFCNTSNVGPNHQWAGTTTPHKTAPQGAIIKIGTIVDIVPPVWDGNQQCLHVQMASTLFNMYFSSLSTNPPSFIMFSKDNKVNLNSVTGYYASVEFRNNSTDKAELFNVGTDFFESSK